MTTNIYNMADTWNNVATTFTAILMNVTDTNSAAGSKLLDLQVGSVSRVSIDKTGPITVLPTTSPFTVFKVDANRALYTPGGGTFTFGDEAGTRGVVFDMTNSNLHITNILGFQSSFSGTGSNTDTGFSRVGAADIAAGNGTAADASANFRVGSLRINQTPTAVSNATLINSGADSTTNLGHRVSMNLNGTTYWIPCGSVAF